MEREDLLRSAKSLKTNRKMYKEVRKPGSYLADLMPDLEPVTVKFLSVLGTLYI